MDLENASEKDFLPSHIIERRMNYEADRDMNGRYIFDDYAKEWWNDYKQIRESLKTRIIPIFVETDDRDIT